PPKETSIFSRLPSPLPEVCRGGISVPSPLTGILFLPPSTWFGLVADCPTKVKAKSKYETISNRSAVRRQTCDWPIPRILLASPHHGTDRAMLCIIPDSHAVRLQAGAGAIGTGPR